MVESSLGVVGACLPSMRPVFVGCSSQGFVRKLRSFSYFSSLHSKPSNDQVEFATRISDADSGSTIAHIIRPKISFSGSAAQWYDPDRNSKEGELLLTLVLAENTATCVIQTHSILRNRWGVQGGQIQPRSDGHQESRALGNKNLYFSVSAL